VFAGGVGLLVGLLLLTFFVEVMHVWYLAASLMTFVVATFVSFWMQKMITFGNEEVDGSAMSQQMTAFYLFAAVNAGVNALLLYSLVEYFGIFYLVAQVCTSATIAFYSFFAYRLLFRQTQTPAMVEDRPPRA
jgi:putative flippase GtrA